MGKATTGEFTLVMELTRPVPTAIGFELKVLNVLGQVVYEENLGSVSGKYKKVIDLSGRAKGVYNLQLMTDEETATYKIILQ